MAKKPSKSRGVPKKAAKVPVKTSTAAVEEQTITRVERTIRSLDEFLAKWDASKVKPDDMFPQVVKIRQFHEALTSWQRDAVKSRRRDDEESRVRRLRDFVMICRMYS